MLKHEALIPNRTLWHKELELALLPSDEGLGVSLGCGWARAPYAQVLCLAALLPHCPPANRASALTGKTFYLSSDGSPRHPLLTPLQELPSLQATPTLTAGSLLSGAGVSWLLRSHLPLNHLPMGGNSPAPPPACGGRKREPYFPTQGPLIPGQSSAKQARRKHVVLPGMCGAGENTLNNA